MPHRNVLAGGLDPVGVKAAMREKCWNARNARAYDRYRTLSRREGWRRILQAELAGIPRGSVVLEVGSGTGFITEILISLGFRVAGFDLSREMLARARTNLAAAGLGDRADLREGDAEELPAPDNGFSAVISRWVLWTLPRPRKGLAEMVRVLAPGGKAVIIDGRARTLGRMASFRATLTDMVLSGRLPGWRTQSYAGLDAALPHMDAPETATVLQELGLVHTAYRRLASHEGDGRWNNWLMGNAWESSLTTGVKPTAI